ncbi:protein kinase C and casein kinase substrate in neurons protein 1 isoform X2 [Hydra vulgaris]|uniref:Protein kinase C and casein kinase substrate in neurons protein 1 isoform X2 n=1 Tax=Hydra vulgaris TaxID=6087 RepID=A0ABM4BH14_HYDVU
MSGANLADSVTEKQEAEIEKIKNTPEINNNPSLQLVNTEGEIAVVDVDKTPRQEKCSECSQDCKTVKACLTQFSNTKELRHEDILENFWVENNYKKVVKRIEDGVHTIDDLSKMVEERSAIESFYGNKLKGWSLKWFDTFNRYCESNMINQAVKKSFDEVDSLATLQLSISSKLEALSNNIVEWRNVTYCKQFTKLKEVKRSEEAFAKAQKPWVIKSNEVLKWMIAYHNAGDSLDAVLKINNIKAVSDVPDDQKRLKDKLRKLEEEVLITRGKYEEAIRDISNYNPKYQDDMRYEFNNCQTFEEARKNFVKESLLNYHACLNRTSAFEIIYDQLKRDYETINVDQDNKLYQAKFGDEHPFETDKFIDYQSALRQDPIKYDVNQNSKKSGVCMIL